jgi:hypothetical protein
LAIGEVVVLLFQILQISGDLNYNLFIENLEGMIVILKLRRKKSKKKSINTIEQLELLQEK